MSKSYAVGDRVTQAQYGDGTIAAVDMYHTRIDFDTCGVRTFATDRVILTPSMTAAPPKRAASRRKSPAAVRAVQAQEGTSV